MVKIEDYDEDGSVSTGARVIRNAGVDPQPGPTYASVIKLDEEDQPSSSSSLGTFLSSDNEERSFKQDMKEPDCFSERRSYLLTTMNFSQEEVDLAFHQLGEEAPLDQLVDCIITAQGAGSSGVKEKAMVESFYGEADKHATLLGMGFTEKEVSSAIDSFGEGTPVQELADSIFARRFASTIEQEQVKTESEFLGEGQRETEYSKSHHMLSFYDDDDDKKRVKKAKHLLRDDRGASTSRVVRQPSLSFWSSCCVTSFSNGSLKEEVLETASVSRANFRGRLAKPPFFLYGNVIDITKDTWGDLSRFLFGVQPEFVNAQQFSALARKEGYLHNLPRGKRFVPKSPMTIQDVFSFTRQFWPPWDKRKHIYGVTSEVAGADQVCGELERMTRNSQGILSEEKQAQIMQQCKIANLIWVGKGRLSPLQPQQLERILGYRADHTDLFGLNPQERIAAMTDAFQVHTVAHLLSTLKDRYPDGLRVLSIDSGVGGAEVALHRLGIRLKCVVSVEQSEVNRKILRQWWAKTEQTGKLKQLPTTSKLTMGFLKELMDEFGGIDLVVGGTYRPWTRGGGTVSVKMGMDSDMFQEYARVVKFVRDLHGL